jgi:hypothetical protein
MDSSDTVVNQTRAAAGSRPTREQHKRSTVVVLDGDDDTTCADSFSSFRRHLSSRYARVTDRMSGLLARRDHAGMAMGGRESIRRMADRGQHVINTVSCTARRFSTVVGDLPVFQRRHTSTCCDDAKNLSFWRDVVGEFIGTFFLVVVGSGASVQHGRRPDTERDLRIALAIGTTTTANCIVVNSETS